MELKLSVLHYLVPDLSASQFANVTAYAADDTLPMPAFCMADVKMADAKMAWMESMGLRL